MAHIVKILRKEHLTHDVLRIVAAKPDDLTFEAGQAVDISINKKDWETELRPFTFTSLPADDYIEFIIKTYPDHEGVTNELLSLSPGDELMLHDVWGEIRYKGEGIFIAGGAGITPFVPMLRNLEQTNKIGDNKLIFANRTKADIILEEKFKQQLNQNFINVLSQEELPGYERGYISAGIIKKQITDNNQYIYLCGPEAMMDVVEKQLKELGVKEEMIVKEVF